MKKNKKLALKKERIASLSEESMANVKGGGGNSSIHNFTCGWCTTISGGDDKPTEWKPGPSGGTSTSL